MREFVSSAGFKYTIKDVLADDESNSQFQGEWTKKPLTESLLFSDWKNVWKQLQPVYENEFKTLVFYKLPEIKAIDESMEFIIKSV